MWRTNGEHTAHIYIQSRARQSIVGKNCQRLVQQRIFGVSASLGTNIESRFAFTLKSCTTINHPEFNFFAKGRVELGDRELLPVFERRWIHGNQNVGSTSFQILPKRMKRVLFAIFQTTQEWIVVRKIGRGFGGESFGRGHCRAIAEDCALTRTGALARGVALAYSGALARGRTLHVYLCEAGV